MKKVVINERYGEFSLSPKATTMLYALKNNGAPLYWYKKTSDSNNSQYSIYNKISVEDIVTTGYFEIGIRAYNEDFGDSFKINEFNSNQYLQAFVHYSWDIDRTDPDLIKVVEELGPKANGMCADLKIKEIEDKYYIEAYDGMETLLTPENIPWRS